MNTDREQRYVELAPLTPSFVMNLVPQVYKIMPHPVGRPRKNELETDISKRTETRLLNTMDYLIELVKEKRDIVYNIVAPAVSEGLLTPNWLIPALDQYMPANTIVYPQRVREWRQAGLLYWSRAGVLDPQSVSRILLSRIIDSRRSGWLPRSAPSEPFWVWRLNEPQSNPYPYSVPLILIDDTTMDTPIYKSCPEPSEAPYVLASPWKGAAWEDEDWVVYNSGAARWAGQPTDEQLDAWQMPEYERHVPEQGRKETKAKRTLRMIVATRFPQMLASDR